MAWYPIFAASVSLIRWENISEEEEGHNSASLPHSLRGINDPIRAVMMDMVVGILVPVHNYLYEGRWQQHALHACE